MKRYLVTTLFISILLWSCDTYTYIPTEHHIMPFEEKGDILIGGGSGMANGELKAGYAFTDNLGVVSSINTLDILGDNNSDNYKFFNEFSWDNELVLYKRFSPNLYFGVNTGLGFGMLNAYNEYYHINTNKQYILPWINGITTKNSRKNFYGFCGASLKFSRLGNHLINDLTYDNEYDQTMYNIYFNADGSNLNKFELEGGLTFGYNFDFVKFQYQLITPIVPSHDDYIFPMNIVFSLNFNLGYFFRNKKAVIINQY